MGCHLPSFQREAGERSPAAGPPGVGGVPDVPAALHERTAEALRGLGIRALPQARRQGDPREQPDGTRALYEAWKKNPSLGAEMVPFIRVYLDVPTTAPGRTRNPSTDPNTLLNRWTVRYVLDYESE